jgi:DNA-binding response OmpR family regulator
MRKNDYEIIQAQNGFDAIRLIKEQKPALVILDVMMPGLSGYDVCSSIKADPSFKDIPVIFLTALDTREGAHQGLEAGGIDYLTKPVDLDLLRLRVKNHIESKERNDLLREQRDLLIKQKEDLEAALARIKRLEGTIPICAYCKKIRDDQQSWKQLETYISEHSEALFSHGICPDCYEMAMKEISEI